MRTITGVCVLMLVVSLASAQAPIDNYTTFMASFDKTVEPDYCAGDWRAAVSGSPELVDGRSGNALFVPVGQSVTFNADQKINLSAGTIEFWLLWTEEMASAESSVSVQPACDGAPRDAREAGAAGGGRVDLAAR